MQADKLIIVAHPDDELLWGGANLLCEHGWHLVVSTHRDDHVRREELAKTASWLGIVSWEMHDVRDEYTEDCEWALENLYKGSQFTKRVAQLARSRKWKLVLTHNSEGEYGHGHHKAVSYIVTRAFKDRGCPVKFFDYKRGIALNRELLMDKMGACRFYAGTQAICKLGYQGKLAQMKEIERMHFANEVVYGKSKRRPKKVPMLLHQIWFGSAIKEAPGYKRHLFKKNVRVCEASGVEYRLWTANDWTPDNFPITWKAMQKALEEGKRAGTSRWAQVADLARYEIVHRFGGIYMDSNFEISDRLFKYMNNKNLLGKDFIGCNEDPCGLKCTNGKGVRYLTNGFFAATPRHPILATLLDKVLKEKVNLHSRYVNRTTGPYFLRSGISDDLIDRVGMIDTELMYPFIVNDTPYRKAKANECLMENAKGEETVKVRKGLWLLRDCKKQYRKALAIYHSGLGGSWSW